MAFNFPASPADGDVVTQGGIRYVYQASRGVWTVDINDRFIPSEQLETLDTSIGGYTTVDYDILDGDAVIASRSLQVGDIAIDAGARPTSGEGLFVVGADNAGATGTTAGDFALGDSSQFVSWDASDAELTIQGRITNVTSALLNGESLPSDTQQFSASQNITGLFGEGIYVAILWGGGGGGGARTNSSDNNIIASGGGAAGMSICAFNYDGTSTLQYNHASGGGGGTATGTSGVNGNSGGTGQLQLAGTTIMQANGGSGGGSLNADAAGGTGTVNLTLQANGGNALFIASNSNANKGSSNNRICSGGGGVVIPTIENEDANLTARPADSGSAAAGGGMLSNQASRNTGGNTSVNYISGFASFPNVAGSSIGNGGSCGIATNASAAGGAGGRFCGGGGGYTPFGGNGVGAGGSGNMGGGGGGGHGGRTQGANGDNGRGIGGSGGAGGLIISRL